MKACCTGLIAYLAQDNHAVCNNQDDFTCVTFSKSSILLLRVWVCHGDSGRHIHNGGHGKAELDQEVTQPATDIMPLTH